MESKIDISDIVERANTLTNSIEGLTLYIEANFMDKNATIEHINGLNGFIRVIRASAISNNDLIQRYQMENN